MAAARDFLEEIIRNTPTDARERAMAHAYDALEFADAGNYTAAMDAAVASLSTDPLNPWALAALGDAGVGLRVSDESEWSLPHVQAQRLPGLLGAYQAGLAVAFAKQATMNPPLNDVWNMVEARPYVRVARMLIEALTIMGHDDQAAAIQARLKAQGVWVAQ